MIDSRITYKCIDSHVSEQMGQLEQFFTEAGSQACSLQKLCIMCIRRHMPSKRNEDFDMLNLPSMLKSLISFNDVAHELQQIISKVSKD